MTICYPLTRQTDYTELKYSLRSIERFLAPPYEILVVGDYLPEWVTNVTQIGLSDIPGKRQISVRRKIFAALEYSNEILFMNDDIYLLQTSDFPYFRYGDLKANGMSGSKPLRDQLTAMGKPTNSFELHYPIIFKHDFKGALQNFTEDTLIRSAYCNYLGIEGVEMPDCKLIKATKPDQIINFIKDKPCFSTGTHSLQSALPILEKLFPQPSKFEI